MMLRAGQLGRIFTIGTLIEHELVKYIKSFKVLLFGNRHWRHNLLAHIMGAGPRSTCG